MPFTAKLGTADSRLASMILGGTGGPLTFERDINDTLTFTDVMVGVNIEISDTLTFTETMVPQIVVTVPISETLTFTDVAYKTLLGDWTDTLTFTDDFGFAKNITAGWSDTLVLSDTITPELIAFRTFNEALELSEQLLRNIIKIVGWSDTLVLTDSMDGYVPKLVTDLLTFSDETSGFIVKTIRELLELGETWNLNANFLKHVNDVLELYELLRVNTHLNLSSSDTLTLVDTVTGIRTVPISELIAFADEVSATSSKLLLDSLVFTDAATFNQVTQVSALDLIAFADVADPRIVLLRTLEDTLTLVDQLIAIRAQFFDVTDSISFLDELIRELHEALAPDTLSFTSQFSAVNIASRTIDDVLAFIESATYNVVYNRSIAETLRFFERPPSQIFPNTTPDTAVGSYGIVAGQMMMFIGQTRAVVINPPEWNDYEADRSQVIFKRKMGGAVSTYVRTCADQKFHYDFVVGRGKANELRAFLDEENGRYFTIYDWKGQIWVAKLLSDTVEKAELGRWDQCVGNKTRISLDFIGARYA